MTGSTTTRRAAVPAPRPRADAGTLVLDLSYQLSSLPDRPAFLAAAAEELARAFDGEVVSWNDVLVAAHRFDSTVHPRTPETAAMMAALAPLAGVHPVVRSFMAGGDAVPVPRRVSDVMSPAGFRRTRVYQDPFAAARLEHQLGIVLDVRPAQLLRGWAVVRSGRDFDDDQMALARLLQPLLVALDRMHGAPAAGRSDPAAAERYRLTARELEVLRLLATGCTARQIATGLRISERTVHRHLGNTYAKLGSRDRLGAVLTARAAGLVPGP